MPVFIANVRRTIKVAQKGDFVVEAADVVEARQKAANELAGALVDIEWANERGALKNAEEVSVAVESVELVADGDEDIT